LQDFKDLGDLIIGCGRMGHNGLLLHIERLKILAAMEIIGAMLNAFRIYRFEGLVILNHANCVIGGVN
jgi:hypothetical protein